MKDIFTSVSSLVFFLLVVTACALAFMKTIDAKDFIALAGTVFSYYFGRSKGIEEGKAEVKKNN